MACRTLLQCLHSPPLEAADQGEDEKEDGDGACDGNSDGETEPESSDIS